MAKIFAKVNGLHEIFNIVENDLGQLVYDTTNLKDSVLANHDINENTIFYIESDVDDRQLDYKGTYIYSHNELFSNYDNKSGQYIQTNIVVEPGATELGYAFGKITPLASNNNRLWNISYHIQAYSSNTAYNSEYDVCLYGYNNIILGYCAFNAVGTLKPYLNHVIVKENNTVKVGFSFIADGIDRGISIIINDYRNCIFEQISLPNINVDASNVILFDASTNGFVQKENVKHTIDLEFPILSPDTGGILMGFLSAVSSYDEAGTYHFNAIPKYDGSSIGYNFAITLNVSEIAGQETYNRLLTFIVSADKANSYFITRYGSKTGNTTKWVGLPSTIAPISKATNVVTTHMTTFSYYGIGDGNVIIIDDGMDKLYTAIVNDISVSAGLTATSDGVIDIPGKEGNLIGSINVSLNLQDFSTNSFSAVQKIAILDNTKYYPVELDANEQLAVYVPWEEGTNTDEKQKVTATTSGTFYLSGVGTTSTTPSVGVADATIKVVNRVLTATSASLTNATISTANITTINGVTVGSSPKFTDTVYTHPGKTLADTTSSATPAHGGTFSVVDSVTRDSSGHVSGINVKTVTLPASGNTDYRVNTQVGNGTIYLSGASTTASTTASLIVNASVYMSAGFLYSNKTKVSVEGHTHGNISSTGSLTDTAAAAAGNDYVVIRDADNNKIQTSTIKGTDVADAVSKKHSHSTGTVTIAGFKYDGSHTLSLPSTDPYTSARTPSAHTHGNITNDGKITTSNSIANGDAFVISRTTAGTLSKSTITFDGATTNSFLSKKGTWETISGGADEKVKVSSSATNSTFPLLAAATSSVISGNTYQAIYDTGIVINPYIHSVAEGDSNTASGVNAHAEGFSTTASGYASHAEGELTAATATSSHAEGYQTIASGTASHAEGYETTASGTASHAEGRGTNASAPYAHASGYYTLADKFYETVIGTFNATSSEGDLFVVGCGNSTAGRRNAMRVNAVDEDDSHSIYWYFNNNTYLKYYGAEDTLSINHQGGFMDFSGVGDAYILGPSANSHMWVYASEAGIQSSEIKLKGVGSNGTTVSVTGRVNATQGFFQTSDINKKNILGDIDLQKAYDFIDKCQEILYSLKDDKSNKQEIGMIAQEVNEFFPELISKDNNGYLSLDYSKLTVIILKVMKDLIRRIDKLENKD